MSDDGSPTHYISYLLRVWRVDNAGRCRALLENVATGERVGFDDLGDLPAFLKTQIQRDPKGLQTFRVSNGGNDE
ncbi:MAG: hypothetical protein H5T61_07330 [Thermoflexales bacterium]|nr:hypothetical protein [Thermoflexales bacterium]